MLRGTGAWIKHLDTTGVTSADFISLTILTCSVATTATGRTDSVQRLLLTVLVDPVPDMTNVNESLDRKARIAYVKDPSLLLTNAKSCFSQESAASIASLDVALMIISDEERTVSPSA